MIKDKTIRILGSDGAKNLKNMIFDLDSRWMEILSKASTVDTSKMNLPLGIHEIYNTEKLSNEDKLVVTANRYIIRLINGKALVMDCSLEQLEMWINTTKKDEIKDALKPLKQL